MSVNSNPENYSGQALNISAHGTTTDNNIILFNKYFSHINVDVIPLLDQAFFNTLDKVNTLFQLNQTIDQAAYLLAYLKLPENITHEQIPNHLSKKCLELFQKLISNSEIIYHFDFEGGIPTYHLIEPQLWNHQQYERLLSQLSTTLSQISNDHKIAFIVNDDSIVISRRIAFLWLNTPNRPPLIEMLEIHDLTHSNSNKVFSRIVGFEKWLLCTSSPVFNKAFNWGGQRNKIDINRKDLDLIIKLLSNPSEKLPQDQLLKVIQLAHFYQLNPILESYVEQLLPSLENMNYEELKDVLLVASLCDITALREPCQKLMSKMIKAFTYDPKSFKSLIDDLSKLQTSILVLNDLQLTRDQFVEIISILTRHRKLLIRLCSLDLSSNSHLTDDDLIPLTRFSNMEAIALKNTPITTRSLIHLQSMNKLRSLDISNCTNIIDFAPLSLLLNLQSLNVSYCPGFTDEEIKHLQPLTYLQFLGLSQSSVDPANLAIVGKLLRLENLDLSNLLKLEDQHLETLSSLYFLTHLELSGCPHLVGPGLLNLKECKKLRSLNLSDCIEISGALFSYLREIAHQLTSLNLSGCRKLRTRNLHNIEKLSSLRNLNISRCPLINFAELTSLAHLTRLVSLNLSESDIADPLVFLPNIISLQSLDLSNCATLNDNQIKFINQCSRLIRLNLSGCTWLTSYGIDYLSNMPNLESLDLSNFRLDDNALRFLHPLPSLQNLKLTNWTNLEGQGLSVLSNLNLITLDITGCTKLYSKYFIHLLKCKSLKVLKFSSSPGLHMIIQSLKNHPSLECIFVDFCQEIPDMILSDCLKIPCLRYVITSGRIYSIEKLRQAKTH